MTSVRDLYAVHVHGDGPTTLLLAHGLASDQSIWGPLAARLSDLRLVTFDYPGAGAAAPAAYDPVRHASLDGYAQDLLAIVDAFGGPAPVVVGHSMSAAIALLAARQAPGRIARLIALAPSPRYLDDPPDYRGGFSEHDIDELLELMESNFLGWATTFAQAAAPQPDLAVQMSQTFARASASSVRTLAAIVLRSDLRDLLPAIDMPTLVVQCAHDAIVPVHVGEHMARALPRGAYRLIDVAGHFPHLSAPDLVASVIRDALGGA
ncbi:MAG: alpha/beta hydrolase [Deltaproteobacteria bacterium]|nr:alpha/beta hydrolase [Deltaproteobacteria bacterium]